VLSERNIIKGNITLERDNRKKTAEKKTAGESMKELKN